MEEGNILNLWEKEEIKYMEEGKILNIWKKGGY